MATTLSRNLKLKIDSNLTASAKYNLERIDALGSVFLAESTDAARVRSITDILIEPESPDVGGSGTGGTVSFGSDSHEITTDFYGDVSVSGDLSLEDSLLFGDDRLTFDLDGADRVLTLGADFSVSGAALSLILSAPLSLTLPGNYGTAGQILSSNGAGVLSWTNAVSGGDVNGYSTSWSTADGLSKSVTHGLNSTDVQVSVLDLATNEAILVDTITTTSANALTLTSSEAPSSSWKVVVQA